MLLVGGEHATKQSSTYTESLGLLIDSRFLLYIGNVWSDTVRGLRLNLHLLSCSLVHSNTAL